jgi:stearoyl-CoA desaturase (Delta-9 desaturase)
MSPVLTWTLYRLFSTPTLIFYIVFLLWLDGEDAHYQIGFVSTWVLMYVLTFRHAILGMSLGFHRYFAHTAFKAKRWFEFVLAYSCAAAAQGGIAWWAANHRQHHGFCDVKGDPHSPVVSHFVYAWFLCVYDPTNARRTVKLNYPETVWLDRLGFLVPWLEWGLVWYITDSRALATLLTILPAWLAEMSTLWFNVRAHGGPADQDGCTANNNYKYSSGYLLGEWAHKDHHEFPGKAHRPEVDLPYWLVLYPMQKLGVVWDLRER